VGTAGKTITVYPTISTTYTVQVKSGFDTCYAVATVSVSACAGTEELELTNISIFPNPATNEVNISNQTTNTIEARLINALGEIILTTCEQKIDVSALPRDLYILNISSDTDGSSYKKILLLQ
jgi:hypothetical protein